MTLGNIAALESEIVPLTECTDRVVARNLRALVDSPSVDVSLKDGYSMRSEEIDAATPESPVRLKLSVMAAAGLPCDRVVAKGSAVRILTGAQVPVGATAVVSEEFTRSKGGYVTIMNSASPQRNDDFVTLWPNRPQPMRWRPRPCVRRPLRTCAGPAIWTQRGVSGNCPDHSGGEDGRGQRPRLPYVGKDRVRHRAAG